MLDSDREMGSSIAETRKRQISASEFQTIFDAGVPIFILIDPLLGEPLPGAEIDSDTATLQNLRKSYWGRDIQVVPLSSQVELPPHQHPYLVALTGYDDPLLATTLAIAQSERNTGQSLGLEGEGGAAHRIAGWLQSSMHAEPLASHLSMMLKVNTAATTRATYFRVVDRRTLALLRHVIGDQRIADSFGRLQKWCYLDILGNLSVVRSSSDAAQPVRLSVDEWCLIEHGERVNRALAQYLGELDKDSAYKEQSVQHLYKNFLAAATQTLSFSKKYPHRYAGAVDQATWMTLMALHPGLEGIRSVNELICNEGSAEDPPELLRFIQRQVRVLATRPAGLSQASDDGKHGSTSTYQEKT